jgi:hypothetical protein
MNQQESTPRTPPDPVEEQAHLKDLANDEAYWDYLDGLEFNNRGAREWDSPCGA